MRRPAPTFTANYAQAPSTARIYDYYLGGRENYQVDRDAAERAQAAVPESVDAVRANRAFLYRAVRFLAGEAGITQFLDIGSGLPTQLNVHEVAHGVAPDAHVVYVDYDPVVRAYGDALLATTDTVRFTLRDLRMPEELLRDPIVHSLIDFRRPVAVLLIAILQFIDEDEDPGRIMSVLRDALPSGSFVAISHVVDNPRTRLIGDIQRAADTPAWTPRSAARIDRFFDGLELTAPGLVCADQWRPDRQTPTLPWPDRAGAHHEAQKIPWLLAGVGRKP